MKVYLNLLGLFILVPSFAFSEILWQWDLTELPSGWSCLSYWDFTDTGTHLYIRSSGPARLPPTITTHLSSNYLILPESADGKEIRVSCFHSLRYRGLIYDATLETSIEARADCNGTRVYPFRYNDFVYAGVHSWDSLWTDDEGMIQSTFPFTVNEGDTLLLQFYFHTHNTNAIFSIFTWWYITDLTVETIDTAIDQTTWGSIKSLSF